MQRLNMKKMRKKIRAAASQRKAENRTFYTDHLKTLAQEQNITGVTINSGDPDCKEGFLEFTKPEYKFTKFEDLSFGKDSAIDSDDLMQVSGICFYYCSFSMCSFSNIHFENCSFVGCDFIECYTLGIVSVFKDCSFVSRKLGKKNIEDMPSLFEGCEFTARFLQCDLTSIVFDRAHFYFSCFENVCLSDAIMLDCSFDTTQMNGCNLRGTKIVYPKFIEFSIEDTGIKTKVDRKTFLDYICFDKKEEREVRFAIEVYDTFSDLFDSNKIMDLSGEYFFLSQKTGISILEGFDKLKSILSFITCGYGERPSYSLGTSLLLVLVCGTLYMMFGVNCNNEILAFHPTFAQLFPPLDSMIIWYHFSLVTFSTVGYGNVVPVGGSLVVSAVEMVLGVIMVGIWVSTLVRKMTRN